MGKFTFSIKKVEDKKDDKDDNNNNNNNDKAGTMDEVKPNPQQEQKKKSYTVRQRQFFITQFDISKSKAMTKYFESLKSFRFGIATREICPTTGRIHDHFFVQVKVPITLSNAAVGYANIKSPKGSVFDNIGYIYKLKEPWKRGLVWWKSGEPTYSLGLKVKDAITMTTEDIKELPLPLYRAVKEVKSDFSSVLKASATYKEVRVFYLWGETHTLKSKHGLKFIERCCGDEYESIKFINNFWNGAKGLTTTALYDEFRDSHMSASMFLSFIDYNVQGLNIKRDTVLNNYTKIVITSVQDPVNLYKTDEKYEHRGQWLRRMKIFHFAYDEEAEEYYHEEEDYTFDIKKRKGDQTSKYRGKVLKHLDGSLLTNEELEQAEEEAKEEPKEDPKEEPISLEIPKEDKKKVLKKEEQKNKKKLDLSPEELRKQVYASMYSRVDKLPETEEELRALIAPIEPDEEPKMKPSEEVDEYDKPDE